VVAGSVQARFQKNMQQQFLFEAHQQSHFPISQTINDTIAFTQIDHLTLLLDASDSTLAGELLAEYGSLKARGYFFLPNDLALCASNFRLEGFLEAPVDVVTLAVTI
jgi:hypothetical protein